MRIPDGFSKEHDTYNGLILIEILNKNYDLLHPDYESEKPYLTKDEESAHEGKGLVRCYIRTIRCISESERYVTLSIEMSIGRTYWGDSYEIEEMPPYNFIYNKTEDTYTLIHSIVLLDKDYKNSTGDSITLGEAEFYPFILPRIEFIFKVKYLACNDCSKYFHNIGSRDGQSPSLIPAGVGIS